MKIELTAVLTLNTEEIERLKIITSIAQAEINSCLRKQVSLQGLSFSEMQELDSFTERLGSL